MDSINPAKKRKAAGDPLPSPGNDAAGAGAILSANISLADLHRLIDQRVADAVEGKTLTLSTRVDGLQREIEGLALRCKSLERSVQVSKREGNWTYSAPDVPRSYWIDQGHDQEYADDAEHLIQSIKECTQRLRSASCSEAVLVEGLSQSPTRSDTALDPHWEQLSNAIQLSEHIEMLYLDTVQLNVCSLQKIEASLRQKGVTDFFLSDNQFHGDEGVQFAIDALKSNRSVETFSWTWNPFHSTEEACKLVDAVLQHPNIRKLELTRSLNEEINPHTPVKLLFGGVGADTLLSVNLSVNGIKTNGDRCIPNFLSANPAMKELDLEGNRLTDDDALHIGLAMQSNTNLRILDLQANALTQDGEGAMYLHSVLGYSRSDISPAFKSGGANLSTVSEANHTCQIYGIIPEQSKQKIFMNDSDKPANWNRRRKLFALLFGRHRRGCNVSQLELELLEDGMGLVPHVLACINTYSGDGSNRCLSILFDLVRNWKTPEVFQPRQV